jgi:error-prone DNA polymerase
MGFYAPSQIVQDAARHGVEVRSVDVRFSNWDCSLEGDCGAGFIRPSSPALRLGLRLVKGLGQPAAERIQMERAKQAFGSLDEMVERCALDRSDVSALAAADALQCFAANRYQAHWQAAGVENPLPVFNRPQFNEAAPLLGRPGEMEDVIADYASTGLSLKSHPLALLRERLDELGVRRAEELQGEALESGGEVQVAGLVICRQRPDTASGVLFVTLEDETGVANLIVWPKVVESRREALLNAGLILVTGTLQHQDGVTHVIVQHAVDCTAWLEGIEVRSRNFAEGIRVTR